MIEALAENGWLAEQRPHRTFCKRNNCLSPLPSFPNGHRPSASQKKFSIERVITRLASVGGPAPRVRFRTIIAMRRFTAGPLRDLCVCAVFLEFRTAEFSFSDRLDMDQEPALWRYDSAYSVDRHKMHPELVWLSLPLPLASSDDSSRRALSACSRTVFSAFH